jgi:hypothetical protein
MSSHCSFSILSLRITDARMTVNMGDKECQSEHARYSADHQPFLVVSKKRNAAVFDNGGTDGKRHERTKKDQFMSSIGLKMKIIADIIVSSQTFDQKVDDYKTQT